MVWNGITDRAAFWVRRRQNGNRANQNEYDSNSRENIFLHELHLDNMSGYPLLLSILDCVFSTAGISVKNRDQSGGMVDKPLISILIDIR